MTAPVAALLGDGRRLHLHHGPIDLVIGVDAATPADRHRAFDAAAGRFDTILCELVAELPLLRRAMTPATQPEGIVARRMTGAVHPFAPRLFVTPMAAVAGAVADEVLKAIVAAAPLTRAYVNNGGDIALHLTRGTEYAAAIAGQGGAEHGRITIDATTNIRGIATSGQGGRSLSLGIAQSVTVLAHNAAAADVAATLIANAVDLAGHRAITRTPARDIDPDSDLGARPVVTHVGRLTAVEVATALSNGTHSAQSMLDAGLIAGAALFLRGAQRIIGPLPHAPLVQTKTVTHA